MIIVKCEHNWLILMEHNDPARTLVVEKVGYILVGTGFARVQVRHLGGSGGMLPQENFGFLDIF